MKILMYRYGVIVFTGLLSVCNSCDQYSNSNQEQLEGEKLYNGILIPTIWPPRYSVPEVPKNMPVPYLETPPKVISIDVGRQLFVDDFLIERKTVKRTFHYPKYFSSNPVLKSDKPWEKTKIGAPYAAPFSDGVWYDENDKKFKIWYLSGASQLDGRSGFATCYAESDDGINWTKPSLDIVPGTNIVETTRRDSNTMWLDKNEKDPNKRFKLFNIELFEGDSKWRYVLKYSSDGIHWSDGVAHSGIVHDRSTAFFNPFRQVWVLGTRTVSPLGRARVYLEHPDPETGVSLTHKIFDENTDKYNVFWFSAWENEVRNPSYPDRQSAIYNHDAIAYESLLLGYFCVWQGLENWEWDSLGIPKRNEVLIGYSRDGFHWDRPDMHRFIGIDSTTGAWNNGNMQSINGAPLIVGDSLYFYTSGRKINNIRNDSHMSTGLAKLRRDGFASLGSNSEKGFVITNKLAFKGEYLFVNADASNGTLVAELIGENGKVLKGYSKDDCLPISTNGTKIRITWKGNEKIKDIEQQPIKIRFILNNSSLYSFWISEFPTGESGGYTAGGGPGLHSSGMDLPLQ